MNYTSSSKYKWDNENVMEYAMEQAVEAERIKVTKQTKLEDAQKMKAKGYPIEDIADITGLSLGEIKQL